MSKKKNLLKLFSQDVSYYFHTIKEEKPDGHLIYVLKSDSNLDADALEFSPTHIIEELFLECDLKVEKFAPAVFFSEIKNTDELKYKLTEKMEEDKNFSDFIESIKDDYRILEIKDSLLYKKDPEEYKLKIQKEKEEKQKETLEKVIEQQKQQQKQREEALLKFDNNIFNLLKDALKYTIQYEKTDFDYQKTINNIMTNLIDAEKWVMENDKPYNCNIYIHKLNQKSLGVFLSNHQTGYTATLKMNKTKIVAKNVIKLGDDDEVPKYFKDYEFLIKLYDVDTSIFNDWDFKNDTDRFECVINYLAPIFKKEVDDNYQKEVEKHMKENGMINHDDDIKGDDDYDIKCDDDYDSDFQYDEDEEIIPDETLTPKNFYFSVYVPEDQGDLNPPSIALVNINFWNREHHLDDRLGSHSINNNIITALNNAGIYGNGELMEAIWEVVDVDRTEQDIIDSMIKEGFIYKKDII